MSDFEVISPVNNKETSSEVSSSNDLDLEPVISGVTSPEEPTEESKKSDTAAPTTPVPATAPSPPTPAPTSTPTPAPASATSTSEGIDLPQIASQLNGILSIVHPYVAWVDVVFTATLFVGILFAFATFVWMGVPVPVFLTYIALAGLVASGVGKVSLQYNKPLPMVPFPAPNAGAIDATGDRVVGTTRSAVEAGAGLYKRLRVLMTWEEWYPSLRALAVVHLITCNTWVFSMCTLFVAVIILFTVPALYARQRATVDPIAQNTVMPLLAKAGTIAAQAQAVVNLKIGLAVFVVGYVLFWFLGLVSLSCWLTTSATVFLGLDALPSLRPKQA